MGDWKATRVQLNTRIKNWVSLHHRRSIRAAYGLSLEAFWRHQLQAFRLIYPQAIQRVPYYRDHPQDYPRELPIRDHILDVLRELPVLRKAVVRERNKELWAATRTPLTWVTATTGSTGTPLKIAASLGERAYIEAVQHEWIRRVTGHRYPRSLFLTGLLVPTGSENDLFWTDYVFGNKYLSMYMLGSSNRDAIVREIESFRPRCIYAYASALNQLATMSEDRLKASVQERVGVTTSDVLQPHYRDNIENRLCARVYDFYGSQEGSHRTEECEHGRMHIHPLVGVVEILDDADRPAPAGSMGKVVVTGLTRTTMPLIRYEIGDAALSTGYEAGCSCGLQWPTIGHIEGRAEDVVRTRDGRVISVFAVRVMKGLFDIAESQLIQEDYDSFVFRLVKREGATVDVEAMEREIRARMAARLRSDFVVRFEYLSAIPRGPHGKFKAVVSRVKDSQPVHRT
jgi:phenylacetate-CoA ligase